MILRFAALMEREASQGHGHLISMRWITLTLCRAKETLPLGSWWHCCFCTDSGSLGERWSGGVEKVEEVDGDGGGGVDIPFGLPLFF